MQASAGRTSGEQPSRGPDDIPRTWPPARTGRLSIGNAPERPHGGCPQSGFPSTPVRQEINPACGGRGAPHRVKWPASSLQDGGALRAIRGARRMYHPTAAAANVAHLIAHAMPMLHAYAAEPLPGPRGRPRAVLAARKPAQSDAAALRPIQAARGRNMAWAGRGYNTDSRSGSRNAGPPGGPPIVNCKPVPPRPPGQADRAVRKCGAGRGVKPRSPSVTPTNRQRGIVFIRQGSASNFSALTTRSSGTRTTLSTRQVLQA